MIRKNKNASFLARHSAIIVFILAGLILSYILAIPPSERIKLLGSNQTIEEDTPDSVNESVFLDENIGNLKPISEPYQRHSLPSSRIRTRTSLETIFSISGESIVNNLFENRFARYSFSLEKDYEQLELSFEVDQDVKLNIFFNNYTLHRGEVSRGLFRINVDDYMFRKGTNLIEISVDDVGWNIFESNNADLKNIKLFGRFLDKEQSQYKSSFSIEGDEINYIESSRFHFHVDCISEGNLNVEVNDNNIYDAYPVCDGRNRLDVPVDDLRRGKNEVIMESTGDLYLTDMYIENKLNETEIKQHLFSLSSEDIENDIFLNIEFAPSTDEKVADVSINGAKRHLDTYNDFWERNITSIVSKGTNFIEIHPYIEMDVIRLKVYSP